MRDDKVAIKDAAPLRPVPRTTVDSSHPVASLQRRVGNRAVAAVMVQRDEDDELKDGMTAAGPGVPAVQTPGTGLDLDDLKGGLDGGGTPAPETGSGVNDPNAPNATATATPAPAVAPTPAPAVAPTPAPGRDDGKDGGSGDDSSAAQTPEGASSLIGEVAQVGGPVPTLDGPADDAKGVDGPAGELTLAGAHPVPDEDDDKAQS